MKKENIAYLRHGADEHKIHVQALLKLKRRLLPVHYTTPHGIAFDHEAHLDKHHEAGLHWEDRLDEFAQTRMAKADHPPGVEITDLTLAVHTLNAWEFICLFKYDGKAFEIRRTVEHPSLAPNKEQLLAIINEMIGAHNSKQASIVAQHESLKGLHVLARQK